MWHLLYFFSPNEQKPGTKAHMKANDSVLCLNRILHTHSRRETHIISREHASARIQAQALKHSHWVGMWTVCRGSEDPVSWSHGWHSDAGLQSGDLHTASIITFYFAKTKKDAKEDRSRQAPTLGLEAPGSGSRHFDSHLGFSVTGTFSFFLRGRQGPSQLTN